MASVMREKGAQFFVQNSDVNAVFTPEDFTDEHKMIAKTTLDFVRKEVVPHIDALEHQDFDLTVTLLRKAGDLGLLAADVPEEFDGLSMDKVSSALIGENMSRSSSFALSHGAHVGIGTLPIVYFGTEEQKKKYLPDLASGKRLAAYALTEPNAGSDALSARTTAKLSADGRYYVLQGQKQYITNSAFADIFIVYAKIDGERFSAFIVERNFAGVSTGPEEKKMGIKASSTRPLILEDVHVPVENLLGEPGRGHVIAFNILNLGRLKLAIGCVGAAKEALEASIRYALVREQFGQPIANFSLIQSKLAEMAVKTFAAETIAYRTSGALDFAYEEASVKGIEEFAIECSINKVFGSEALSFVVDEGVQIHGGAGFIQDYPMERMYRDARINRIFEGTNEINRLLIPGTLIKRAMKGEVALLPAIAALQQELTGMIDPPDESMFLAVQEHAVTMMRKLILLVGGSAVQKYGTQLEHEQEILAYLADMAIALYTSESLVLRTKKSQQHNHPSSDLQYKMTQLFVHDAYEQVSQWARTALSAMEEGDSLRTILSVVRKLSKVSSLNTVQLKRQLAKRLLETEHYFF